MKGMEMMAINAIAKLTGMTPEQMAGQITDVKNLLEKFVSSQVEIKETLALILANQERLNDDNGSDRGNRSGSGTLLIVGPIGDNSGDIAAAE